MELEIHQVWEYRYDAYMDWTGDELCEIEYIDEIHEEVWVKAIRGPCVGMRLTFKKSDFFGEHFRLASGGQVEAKYGVYCGQCGGYCPYAEFSSNFKCWECRNSKRLWG